MKNLQLHKEDSISSGNFLSLKMLLVVITVLLLVGTIFVYFNFKAPKGSMRLINTSSISDWNMYVNEKYNYEVQYPQVVTLDSMNMFPSEGFKNEVEIEFVINGFATLVGIEAFPPTYFNTSTLKQFSENFRGLQVGDSNPNIPKDRIIGDLYSTTISNQQAYAFDLSWGVRTDASESGYSFGDRVVYIVVLTEDNNGNKYVIRYLKDNEDARKIISTFKFRNTSIKKEN